MARRNTSPAAEPEVNDSEASETVEETAITEDTSPAAEPEVNALPVKIRMATTSAGPDPLLNWNEGQIRTVDADEADRLIRAGFATLKG